MCWADAGLWQDSDALLKASLAKSHSPYYLMSQLGGNARKQGRKDEALRWYEQAFNKSEGPATRLQWGSNYFAALVELAPADAAKIEKTAAQLFSEAAQDKGAFYERSARSLQKVGGKLNSWNADGQHAAVVTRLKTQLDSVCAKVDVADKQRATCEALIRPVNKMSCQLGSPPETAARRQRRTPGATRPPLHLVQLRRSTAGPSSRSPDRRSRGANARPRPCAGWPAMAWLSMSSGRALPKPAWACSSIAPGLLASPRAVPNPTGSGPARNDRPAAASDR